MEMQTALKNRTVALDDIAVVIFVTLKMVQPRTKENKLMPTNKPHGLDPVLIQTERENMLVGESRCRTV